MSQYKGYYTAGSSREHGKEADDRLGGRECKGSQEQDYTEYDNGDGTEYDLGDPGGTSAMLGQQLWRSNVVDGKRSFDEVDHHVDQVRQPKKLLKTSNGAFSRSSNYYSAPDPQTCSTKDWESSELSGWQREREGRRQELLAKRSKVMNRLLELRLEQEGEGVVDSKENREKLNRLLEMRLEQEGLSSGSGVSREASFESDQSTSGNLSYDDDGYQYQTQRTFNPNGVCHKNWQNPQYGREPSDQSNSIHVFRGGLGNFGDGWNRGDKSFSGGNMTGMFGHKEDLRNGESSLRDNRNATNTRGFGRDDQWASNPQRNLQYDVPVDMDNRGLNDFHQHMTAAQNSHTGRVQGDQRNPFINQENGQGNSFSRNWTTHDNLDSTQGNGFTEQGNVRASSLGPELAMPVYQTLEKADVAWEEKMRTECNGDGGDDRASRQEEWAWGTGTKWLGAPSEKPKLNLYAGPPRAEMFENAPKVQGGIGEKLLNQMGWKNGEGLGKTKGGTLEPIKFTEIKTDRRGLDSSVRLNDHEKDLVVRCREEEEEEEMTWGKIKAQKEVDRSDPKSVFSELKSKSFWSWHDTGMKGPENVHQRLRMQKKMVKERAPLDVVGKHPVSALVELCQRRGWNPPAYVTEPSTGAGFLLKVEVQGKFYMPATSSDTKKGAKADAAQRCLEELGLLPKAAT